MIALTSFLSSDSVGAPVPLTDGSADLRLRSTCALLAALQATSRPAQPKITAFTQAVQVVDSSAIENATLARLDDQSRAMGCLEKRGRVDGTWLAKTEQIIDEHSNRAAEVPSVTSEHNLRVLSSLTRQAHIDARPTGRLRDWHMTGVFRANAKVGLTPDRLDALYSNSADQVSSLLPTLSSSIRSARKILETAASLGDQKTVTVAEAMLDANSATREALWRVLDGMSPLEAEKHGETVFAKLRLEAVSELLSRTRSYGTALKRRPRTNQREWHKSPFITPDLAEKLKSADERTRKKAKDTIGHRERRALRGITAPARRRQTVKKLAAAIPHARRSDPSTSNGADTALEGSYVDNVTGQPFAAAKPPPAYHSPGARAESDTPVPLHAPSMSHYTSPSTLPSSPKPVLSNRQSPSASSTHSPVPQQHPRSPIPESQPHSPSFSTDSAAMDVKFLKDLEHHASTASTSEARPD